MEAISKIKNHSKFTHLYSSDKFHQWYFSINGIAKTGRYYDYTFYRTTDGKVVVGEASTCTVSLKTMLNRKA